MKRRLLALFVAMTMVTMVLTPVAGTWALSTPTDAEPAAPVAEEPAPATEAPKAEEPAPATEAPKAEEPAVVSEEPAAAPTEAATEAPTEAPVVTEEPTAEPTEEATEAPTEEPVVTEEPTAEPTEEATEAPTEEPVVTEEPTAEPTEEATEAPTEEPVVTEEPTAEPTAEPTEEPVVETESADVWAKSVSAAVLTGDWASDIVAVAATQVGYAEKNGYVRYADWYGEDADSEWSAMFAGFVLRYAGINQNDYPYAADPAGMKTVIGYMGAYATDHTPKAGDLVFFNHEGGSEPQHVGVVESVEGGLNTIEGDCDGAVVRKSYALDDASIVGYADTAKLQELSKVENVMPDGLPAIAEGGETAYLCASDVNMRAEPTTDSAKVGRIKQFGSELLVTGAAQNDKGEIWYAVTYDGVNGYVRADFVTLSKPAATETPAPTATEAPSATEEPVTEESEEPATATDVEETAPEATEAPVATEEPVVEETVVPEAPAATEEPVADEVVEETPATSTDVTEPAVEETAAPEAPAATEEPVADEVVEETPATATDVTEPEVPALTVVAQPESTWQYGDEGAVLTFAVENAASYMWQQGHKDETGAMVWVEILNSNSDTLAFYTTTDMLKYAYRCVATAADGATVASDAVTLLPETYIDWMNTTTVTDEMLARAMAAPSLEHLVIEGDALVYVRTGLPVARIDESTGYVIDEATGLVVAEIDLANGTISPVSADAE